MLHLSKFATEKTKIISHYHYIAGFVHPFRLFPSLSNHTAEESYSSLLRGILWWYYQVQILAMCHTYRLAFFDSAQIQYAELKKQATGMDAAELMNTRLAVREEK